MVSIAWQPVDDAEAASNLAVLVEWLRATGRMIEAEPSGVRAWAAAGTPEFAATLAGFLGWPAADRPIIPDRGRREAIVRHRAGIRQSWTYADLPARAPPDGDPIALAAFHIFAHDTHPDDRLLWAGDPADPRPLGALYFGATIILADAPTAALAIAERACRVLPSEGSTP